VHRVTRDGATTEIDRFTAPATSLAVAPDGRRLVAGSEDGSLHLHDLTTGRVRQLPAHGERVTALAFTTDGVWLASGCADHTARLWRSDDASFRAFDEGGHGVEQLAFTPDARTLILLSGGETELRRLDLATGEHRTPLAGHGGALLGFTIADDGRRFLTHGASGAVHLIDLADGHGRTLTGHTRRVTGAGFAANGRTIVTLGLEGSVRAWPDDLPETMPELRAWIDAAASGGASQRPDHSRDPPQGCAAIRRRAHHVDAAGDHRGALPLRSGAAPQGLPLSTIAGPARVDLAIFVHRVEGLDPGLYLLLRDPDRRDLWRAAADPAFAWTRADGCPDALCCCPAPSRSGSARRQTLAHGPPRTPYIARPRSTPRPPPTARASTRNRGRSARSPPRSPAAAPPARTAAPAPPRRPRSCCRGRPAKTWCCHH
jgi:hypothetical protein